MKSRIKILIIISFGIIIGCQDSNKENDLKSYLENNWQTPENYILSKFETYDYVFVGEFHRIKHDIELIKGLIPKLYENGVYNLGFEFGCYELQQQSDSLITMPKFDRKLAREIVYHFNPAWNHKEYIDIYKIVWELNSKLKKNQKKFRIVNLTESYVKCNDGEDAWQDINSDEYMANVILNEIVSKKERALIYMGINHAFTKYSFPKYDIKKDSLKGFSKRTGNFVYDKAKDKSFTIFLHSAWPSLDYKKLVVPVHGKIDSVINLLSIKRVGFDTKNTPFGNLTSTNTFYKFGQGNFTLDKFCDGYIVQKLFLESEPVTIEENYFSEDNVDDFKCFMLKIGIKKEYIDSFTIEIGNKLDEDNINKFKKQLID
jgi:hypothetical protein